MSYGPSIPPHLSRRKQEDDDEDDDEDGDVGPRLPEVACRGPPPPPALRNDSSDDDDDDMPLGPALPPHMVKPAADDDDDDDDEGMIGPLPPPCSGDSGSSASVSSAARDVEARAQKMRDKIEGRNQTVEPKREEWMLSLPKEKAKNFGLGPRQFLRNNKSEGKSSKDRSGWTDTPEQREKRARGELEEEATEEEQDPSKDKDVLEYMASLQRDQEMERISGELREKRGSSSLMDMHSKKLKKKSQEDEAAGTSSSSSSKERREFDRDTDLQANRFDNAQKELMIKKARQLNDRFSRGSQKFL